MLTRADIDTIAAYKRKLPDKVSTQELLYFLCVDHLYRDYAEKKISKKDAMRQKSNIVNYLDVMESLAHSNSRIISELSILTAPRIDFSKKSKEELLEVIARIEALVTGIIKEHGDKLPEFMTFKAGKE